MKFIWTIPFFNNGKCSLFVVLLVYRYFITQETLERIDSSTNFEQSSLKNADFNKTGKKLGIN